MGDRRAIHGGAGVVTMVELLFRVVLGALAVLIVAIPLLVFAMHPAIRGEEYDDLRRFHIGWVLVGLGLLVVAALPTAGPLLVEILLGVLALGLTLGGFVINLRALARMRAPGRRPDG